MQTCSQGVYSSKAFEAFIAAQIKRAKQSNTGIVDRLKAVRDMKPCKPLKK